MSKTRRTFNFSQIPDHFVRFDVSTQGLNSTQQGNARTNIGAEPVIPTGNIAQFLRGDKSWQTLNTAAVTESGSLYFTEARVRSTSLTGLGAGSNTAITATDNLLTALANLQNQISNRALTSHTHDTSAITSGTMATARLGSGTANSSVFLRGDSTWASVSVAWGNITSIPSAFTPSAHTHPWSDITSRPTTLSGYGITDAVPSNRTITINGIALDLSANRSWTVGTVTSVAMSVPTGLSVAGSPITSSGTLALTYTAGYAIPTTAKQTEWDAAYTNRITSLTTTGNSGAAALISNVLNVPNYTLSGLGGEPTITAGTTSQYWRGDKTWQDFGGAVRSSLLTGYTVGSNTALAATDSILQAFGKVQGQINARGLATADITAVSLTTTTLTLTRALGNLTASVPTWNQNTTGSAATLTTPRSFTIGATAKTFNGSANVSWSLGEIGAQPAGMYWQVVDSNGDLNTATGYETYYRAAFQSANRPPNTNWTNVFSIRYNDSTLFSQLAFIPGNRLAIRYGESGSWWSWSEIWSQANLPVPVSGVAGSGYTIPRNNWVGSQAQYDAIGSKSNDTIYFIV